MATSNKIKFLIIAFAFLCVSVGTLWASSSGGWQSVSPIYCPDEEIQGYVPAGGSYHKESEDLWAELRIWNSSGQQIFWQDVECPEECTKEQGCP